MNKIKHLKGKLHRLMENSNGRYTHENYSELLNDKSITEIEYLATDGILSDKFPMQLKYISDDCYIEDDLITELPNNLTIGGTLYIGTYSKIKKLPKGLKVGSLSLENDITELPDDIEIENLLHIHAPIEHLENIKCNSLFIAKPTLKTLKNIELQDRLVIDVKENQNLTIYPDVQISNIKINCLDEQSNFNSYTFSDVFELYEKFPQFAPKEGFIDYSDEDMENFEKTEKNKSLINRLHALTEEVGGDYNKHNIKELLTNRNITEIQSFNTLGAEIYRFPRQVHYIAGDCWIDEYCGIAELPDDLTIGGVLTINYSKALDMLPDGLKVGSLRLWSHIVTEIPNDLQVSNNLNITAPVKKVENFSCNNVYLLNKGELTHLKNVHAKGTLTIYLYENRPLTIYPDVTADKGIIAYYIYENDKSQTYNFSDIIELCAEFPQFAPEGYFKDIPDEDMENSDTVSENLVEHLEKLTNGEIYMTSNPKEVRQKLEHDNKDYRILYDKNINTFMFGDAEEYTHWDMLQRAYRDGWYYSMEDFIQSLGGTLDNYIEVGQSGNYDSDAATEWVEPYLFYMVFCKTDSMLGIDGYDKEYQYDFGNLATRGCELMDTPLYNALGNPTDVIKE